MDRFNPCHEHIDAIWKELASALLLLYMDGVLSCFVIKDEYDNRYGELLSIFDHHSVPH